MPLPIRHNLLEPETHIAVAIDGIAREARYLTTYDDGTAGETIHVLYRVDDEVRSEPIETWVPEQAERLSAAPALPTEDADLRVRIAAELQRTPVPVDVDAVLAALTRR